MVLTRPPADELASKTVTLWPTSRNSHAVTRPAIPAPTTAMDAGVDLAASFLVRHHDLNSRSYSASVKSSGDLRLVSTSPSVVRAEGRHCKVQITSKQPLAIERCRHAKGRGLRRDPSS